MDISTITKEEFDLAYNKFPPNAWIKFAYKYFSTTTVKTNFGVKKSVSWVLGILFLLGFLGTVIGLPHKLIAAVIFPYGGILVALAALIGGAAIMNNLRIKKIRKVLGIDQWQYEALVGMFYPSESKTLYILK